MPSYDNIVDAFEVIEDGTPHTIALDSQGASFETNETTWGEGFEGVWIKIDLSNHAVDPTNGDGNIEVTLDAVRTGGDPDFHPYIDIYRVTDPAFDPSSPDFAMLGTVFNAYLGDGTTDPPSSTFLLSGGINGSGGFGDTRSETGVFYGIFTDWDFATYGAADVEVTVPTPPICFDAIDIINPDSTTATIVSGRVRESWDRYWDHGAEAYNMHEKTLKFTWGDPAGLYKMYVTARPSATPSGGTRRIYALASVNGRCLIQTGSFGNPSFDPPASNTVTFNPYNGFDDGDDDDIYNAAGDYSNFPWVILSPGDTVELMIFADMQDGGGDFNPPDIETVCFELDASGPATTYCTGGVAFEGMPIGDEWYDDLGYGGQRLVPDQIYEELGYTIDSHGPSDFAWGFAFTDYDMVALPDGTVYVAIKEAFNAATAAVHPHTTPFANFENSYWFLVIKKYDPGSDTWTQIATLNFYDPITAAGHAGGCLAGPHSVDSVNAYYDPIGGQVYVAWTEATLYSGSSPVRVTRDMHVAQLDPSDDSWAYLGAGFHAQTVAVQSDNTGEDALGCDIAVTTNGDVYITAVETDDDASFGFQRKPYVWRWDGGTWTNLSLPPPSTTSDNNWVLDGENQFWDQLVMVIPYRRDGSQDGVTVHYAYREDSTDEPTFWMQYRSVTIEYTPGGGWTDEILTLWPDVEGHAFPDGRANSGITFPDEYQLRAWDMTLMWSDKMGRLIMTADMVGTGGEEIWDLFQMNDDGDQWEIVESIAPASSAGPWRQSRNSAAIGPDGDPWRGMVSDSVGVNFEPHVIKHSPGYGFGLVNASRVAIGEAAPDETTVFMDATANYRIRWAGDTCFIMGNFATFPMNYNVGGSDDRFADGFFVFRGAYMPCTNPFLPHFYRRVLG